MVELEVGMTQRGVQFAFLVFRQGDNAGTMSGIMVGIEAG